MIDETVLKALACEPKNIALLREQAWVGDAVLALFARRWIISNAPQNADRTEIFISMTCNHFLSAFGEPTKVEARIGRIYEACGEQVAFTYIEETLLPLFVKRSVRVGRR